MQQSKMNYKNISQQLTIQKRSSNFQGKSSCFHNMIPMILQRPPSYFQLQYIYICQLKDFIQLKYMIFKKNKFEIYSKQNLYTFILEMKYYMKISNCQILGGEEGSRRRILKHYLLRLRGLRIQLIMK